MISFDQAYQTTIKKIKPLDKEYVELLAAEGRVTAIELLSKVWSPSLFPRAKCFTDYRGEYRGRR